MANVPSEGMTMLSEASPFVLSFRPLQSFTYVFSSLELSGDVYVEILT
jgi:hypothetical protein